MNQKAKKQSHFLRTTNKTLGFELCLSQIRHSLIPSLHQMHLLIRKVRR
jgi:hypothetical protein